jgi:hypothetical protein
MNVYLIPTGEKTFEAQVCNTKPTANAVFLTEEGEYEASLHTYCGTGMWASMRFACDRDELIDMLNETGASGGKVIKLWDYDEACPHKVSKHKSGPRFIHDDIVVAPSRNAKTISIRELKAKINRSGRSKNCYQSVENLMNRDGSGFKKDIEVDLLGDVVYCESKIYVQQDQLCTMEDKICGFHEVGDLTFFGCKIHNNNCVPIVTVVYWDGSKLRAYTPRWGNYFSAEHMIPFEFAAGCSGRYWDSYLRSYGIKSHEFADVFNPDVMLMDVVAAIQVI